ncbi:MAG: hypothetical protein WAX69_19240 [Victivallales bacterium]
MKICFSGYADISIPSDYIVSATRPNTYISPSVDKIAFINRKAPGEELCLYDLASEEVKTARVAYSQKLAETSSDSDACWDPVLGFDSANGRIGGCWKREAGKSNYLSVLNTNLDVLRNGENLTAYGPFTIASRTYTTYTNHAIPILRQGTERDEAYLITNGIFDQAKANESRDQTGCAQGQLGVFRFTPDKMELVGMLVNLGQNQYYDALMIGSKIHVLLVETNQFGSKIMYQKVKYLVYETSTNKWMVNDTLFEANSPNYFQDHVRLLRRGDGISAYFSVPVSNYLYCYEFPEKKLRRIAELNGNTFAVCPVDPAGQVHAVVCLRPQQEKAKGKYILSAALLSSKGRSDWVSVESDANVVGNNAEDWKWIENAYYVLGRCSKPDGVFFWMGGFKDAYLFEVSSSAGSNPAEQTQNKDNK